MQTINSGTALKEAIIQLEAKHANEGRILRDQFYYAYESIQPINMIKSTFKEVSASKEIKENVLNKAMSLGIGYTAKFLFESVSRGPLKKVIGSAIMMAVQTLVEKNPESFRSIGKGIAHYAKVRLNSRKNLTVMNGTH